MKFRAAIVTVSDTRTAETDVGGRVAAECLAEIGAGVESKSIVTDDFDAIAGELRRLADEMKVDLVLTTGGTGFAPRDNTPEATRAAIEREAPGLAEQMRAETVKINPKAILSRGVCGIRGATLIVNLPGSPKGVRECFDAIKFVLPHAIDILRGHGRH